MSANKFSMVWNHTNNILARRRCLINERSWGNWVFSDCSHFKISSCDYKPFFSYFVVVYRSFTHLYASKLKQWSCSKIETIEKSSRIHNLYYTYVWATKRGKLNEKAMTAHTQSLVSVCACVFCFSRFHLQQNDSLYAIAFLHLFL